MQYQNVWEANKVTNAYIQREENLRINELISFYFTKLKT